MEGEQKSTIGKIIEDVTAPIVGSYKAKLEEADKKAYDYIKSGIEKGEIDPETGGNDPKWAELKAKFEPQETVEPVVEPAVEPQQQQMQQPIQQASYQQPVQQASYQEPQQAVNVSDDDLKKAYAIEAAGIQQAGQSGAEEAVKQAQYMKTMATEMQSFQDKQAEKQARFQKELDTAQTEIRTLTQDIQGTEIKDFWADKTTGQKIMASLAMALGAYGQAYTGGPNQAMQIINTAIDADLNRQKANLQKKVAVRDSASERYRMLLEKFKSEEAADAAALGLMIKKTEMQIQSIAANAMSPKKKADAAILLGQLEQRRLLAERTAAMESAKYNSERMEKMAPRFVADLEGFATSPEDAKAVKDRIVMHKNVSGSVNELIDLSKQYSTRWSPEASAQAKTLKNILIGQLRTAIAGPGPLNADEKKMMEAIIADPSDLFNNPIKTRAALTTLKRSVDSGTMNELTTRGFKKSDFYKFTKQSGDVNFRKLD